MHASGPVASRAHRTGVHGGARTAPHRTAVARSTRATAIVVVVLVVVGVIGPAEVGAVTPCSRGAVALTFDDGPHSRSTGRVLDIFRDRRARATFFVVGRQVATYPSLTQRAHREGHVVANHTYGHERLTSLSDSRIRDTVRRTNQKVASIGVPTPTLLRPPYGATSSRVRNVVGGMGMYHVTWNIDPQDWRSGRSASTISNLVLNDLRDGGVVVMHDNSANYSNTLRALPTIIDGTRSRGYCLGTLGRTGGVVPPIPRVSIDDVKVTETDSTITAYLTVRLSEPTSRKVSVAFATKDGTAEAGRDYTSVAGTVTFPVGQTSRRIAVPVAGNLFDEPNRDAYVELSKPSGVTLSRSTARLRIIDDDPAPSADVLDAQAAEGGAGTTSVVNVPVRISTPSRRELTITYTTENGTAAAGSDYVARSGTLVIAPMRTSASIPVTVIGDDTHEGDETFRVKMTASQHVHLRRSVATVRIIDDDPAPVPVPDGG